MELIIGNKTYEISRFNNSVNFIDNEVVETATIYFIIKNNSTSVSEIAEEIKNIFNGDFKVVISESNEKNLTNYKLESVDYFISEKREELSIRFKK